ncbi:MAG: sigma-70 family RNA polymerase sigma factor [Erysipelotrichaceae bacterium]
MENKALAIYQSDLSQIENLSAQQQQQLMAEAKNGDEAAKKKVVEAYLKLVYKVALKYCNNDDDLLLDLIQEGNIGLIMAIEKYNPEKGSFVSYALYWIEKYILAYLNDNKLIRIPFKIAQELKKLKVLIDELAQQLGHYPSLEEIGQNCELDQQRIRELMNYDYKFNSIDEQQQFYFSVENYLSKQDLTNLLANLDKKDRQIVACHLGLYDDKPMTFQAIGQQMSLTKQAVRSRYIKAMKVIREVYEQ